MPTNYALIQELTEQTGMGFRPLRDGYERDVECYHDDCREWAAIEKFIHDDWIQVCEGHARLAHDEEYQRLRLKWRLNGWGE